MSRQLTRTEVLKHRLNKADIVTSQTGKPLLVPLSTYPGGVAAGDPNPLVLPPKLGEPNALAAGCCG